MDFSQTILLYLLVGIGVAIGLAGRSRQHSGAMLVVSWLFWPLFVPFLVREPYLVSQKDPAIHFAEAEPLIARIASLAGSDSEIQRRIEDVKARWIEQVEWMAEAERLLQELKPIASDRPSSVSELRGMRDQAELSLRQILDELQDLAVAIQLWRAPGADQSIRKEALLIRLDRLSTSQPQDIR